MAEYIEREKPPMRSWICSVILWGLSALNGSGGKLMADMFLWCMRYCTSDWCCYVIAPTRGKAKMLFHEYWKLEGDYCDVRGSKVKPADGYQECVLDVDCEILSELGVHYMTQEEWDAIFDGLW